LIGSAKIDGRFGWSSPSRVAEFVANGVVMLALHAGWAVAASWFTLILIGGWRPEPSWVDGWVPRTQDLTLINRINEIRDVE
jgi:hypothetical protein